MHICSKNKFLSDWYLSGTDQRSCGMSSFRSSEKLCGNSKRKEQELTENSSYTVSPKLDRSRCFFLTVFQVLGREAVAGPELEDDQFHHLGPRPGEHQFAI